MRRAFPMVVFVLVMLIIAGWCLAGEVPPPEKADAEKPAKPAGHGEVAYDIETGKIALVSVDSEFEFKEKDRLLVLTGGPEVAYMVVEKVIKAAHGTLCTCTVEKGGELVMKGMRVINLRIRNAESPPDTSTPDAAPGVEPGTAETQTPAENARLNAAMRRIAVLQREIEDLLGRIKQLEQKCKNLDIRLVSLERSKPDTSVELPTGLDPSATGRVIRVRDDGKVALSIGSEVGIRPGTTLYIYRPKGDGDFFFIGSVKVEGTIETLSFGSFIEKNAAPIENDIVTVLPKKQVSGNR